MTKNFDYRASIILGMHDAIVSLSGLIAGLSVAFADKYIIVLSCIISSASASISMGAANYLAQKTIAPKHALPVALSTGTAYMLTCILMILPFFMFSGRIATLWAVFFVVVGIIYGFNLFFYYKNNFHKHFLEMLSICICVSIIAFFIGEAARIFMNITI